MVAFYNNSIQLLSMSLFHLCFANIKIKTFLRKTDFDDYICYQNNLQAFGHRDNKLSCSKACAEEISCTSFFYNSLYKSCHGSQYAYLSAVSCIEDIGTVYYASGTFNIFGNNKKEEYNFIL